MEVASRLSATLALCSLTPLSACTRVGTEVVVVVDSDMTLGSELDGLLIRTIEADGRVFRWRRIALGDGSGQHTLPGSFGVVPAGNDATRPMRLEIDALRGTCVLMTYRARTSFVPNRRLQLDVFLARDCTAERSMPIECPPPPVCSDPSYTCTRFGCVPAEVDPSELHDFGSTSPDVVSIDARADRADAAADRIDIVDSVDAGSGCTCDSCCPDVVDVADSGPMIEQSSCTAGGVEGCGLVEVPGGALTMGGDSAAYFETDGDGSRPQAGIMVGPFALDAYEVTVGRFRVFWEMARGVTYNPGPSVEYPGGVALPWMGPVTEPESTSTDAIFNWSANPAGREAHPINGVDWYTAQAFCVWDGGRLPTESEWEFYARGYDYDGAGGVEVGRAFPWGDQEPTTDCDPLQVNSCRFGHETCGGDMITGAVTHPVGRYLPNGGTYDLAGNIWEWTADNYTGYADPSCWNGVARINPVCDIDPIGTRVVRGGSWRDVASAVRSASRHVGVAWGRSLFHGFRCARTR